jgi:cytochrome c-type biogenesis protein
MAGMIVSNSSDKDDVYCTTSWARLRAALEPGPSSGVDIFALLLTANEALNQLVVFLWFGLGFGLPLLALSFLSGASQQRWITRHFALHARLVNLIGGILLMGIGLYDLRSNWEAISLFLG